jgi:hypothetical protein
MEAADHAGISAVLDIKAVAIPQAIINRSAVVHIYVLAPGRGR